MGAVALAATSPGDGIVDISDNDSTLTPTASPVRLVEVTNFPNPQNVEGTVNVGNLPSTQQVAGTVSVGNLPAVQQVAGTVEVSNLSLPEPTITNLVMALPFLPGDTWLSPDISTVGHSHVGVLTDVPASCASVSLEWKWVAGQTFYAQTDIRQDARFGNSLNNSFTTGSRPMWSTNQGTVVRVRVEQVCGVEVTLNNVWLWLE